MSKLMSGTVKFEIYVNKTHMHKVRLSVVRSQFICATELNPLLVKKIVVWYKINFNS